MAWAGIRRTRHCVIVYSVFSEFGLGFPSDRCHDSCYAAMNSVVMIASGHAINHPEVRVSFLQGLIALACFVAATAISMTIIKRSLRYSDRAAILIFVCSLFWSAADARVLSLAPIVGAGALVSDWLYVRHLAIRNATGE
jgi:hypothetical protein